MDLELRVNTSLTTSLSESKQVLNSQSVIVFLDQQVEQASVGEVFSLFFAARISRISPISFMVACCLLAGL